MPAAGACVKRARAMVDMVDMVDVVGGGVGTKLYGQPLLSS